MQHFSILQKYNNEEWIPEKCIFLDFFSWVNIFGTYSFHRFIYLLHSSTIKSAKTKNSLKISDPGNSWWYFLWHFKKWIVFQFTIHFKTWYHYCYYKGGGKKKEDTSSLIFLSCLSEYMMHVHCMLELSVYSPGNAH